MIAWFAERVPGGARWAYVFGSALVFLLLAQFASGLALAMSYSASVPSAWASVARLEQSVTDNIKRFEYTLRRKLDANANQVFLSGSDDVPEQYRKLVEQYYRSLSKGGRIPNP